MYRSSGHKSWTSSSASHSASGYPSGSPGPMPSAPHLHTVSLPHPNSTSPYAPSSGSPYATFEGSSRILSLNPLLSWTGAPAPMYYNVTRDVQYIQLQPGCPPNMLYDPAVHPASTHLMLSVPSLPLWSTIEVRNPRGGFVSAYDVLARIRDVLNRSVSPADMGAMGVKRIDFLGPNVLFAGLTRSMDGQDRWEVHFVRGA